jgi:hypothetical protein
MPEDIINYIKNLVFQGKTQDEAIDHATHYFGKTREEIVQIVEQRAGKG